jgi:hypothetical protein
MSTNKLTISTILFFTGIAVGLALAIVSMWADYEAIRYFFTGQVYDTFSGLECPALVSRSESASIFASIRNPTDRVAQPVYKVQMSGPLGQETREQIAIPPYETHTVEWTIDSSNIDLGSFIMAKITVVGFAGTKSREATCGIFVVNAGGLTGGQVLGITLTISLLGIFLGLAIWEREMEAATRGFMQPQRVRRALGLVVLLAMLFSLMGSWIPGLLFCVISVLLLAITILAAVRGA